MTTDSTFLRAILDDPTDDRPRLVYADYLEELGDPRGEFIRTQVELASDPHLLAKDEKHYAGKWPKRYLVLRRRERELWVNGRDRCREEFLPGTDRTVTIDSFDQNVRVPQGRVRRGLVAEVTCTLADFMGVPCQRCNGTGQVVIGLRNEPATDRVNECPDCHGIGYTEGIAPDLFAACPIERVTLTDREPFTRDSLDERYWWYNAEVSHSNNEHPQSDLPQALWELLTGQERGDNWGKLYATPEIAHAALSAACVAWGRSIAKGMTHEAKCQSCLGPGRIFDSGNEWRPHPDCPACCGTGKVRRPGLPPLLTPTLKEIAHV